MRSSRYVLLLGAALLCACGSGGSDSAGADSAPAQVSVEDLVGTWLASTDLYTNAADSSQQFDLVANGGETRIAILAGGRARTWVTLGAYYDEWDAQLSVDGNKLTSRPAETRRPTRVFVFELAGDDITLQTKDSEFDFTRSGASPVPASEYLEMTRE